MQIGAYLCNFYRSKCFINYQLPIKLVSLPFCYSPEQINATPFSIYFISVPLKAFTNIKLCFKVKNNINLCEICAHFNKHVC